MRRASPEFVRPAPQFQRRFAGEEIGLALFAFALVLALEQALVLYNGYQEKASACARIEAVVKRLSLRRGRGPTTRSCTNTQSPMSAAKMTV